MLRRFQSNSGSNLFRVTVLTVVMLAIAGSAFAQPSIVGSGMTPDQKEWQYTPQFQSVSFKFWLQVPPQAIVNRYGTHDYNFNVRVYRPDGTEVWNTVYGFNEKGYCETSFWLPSLFLERSANRNTPDFGTWRIRLAVIEKDSRRDVAFKDFPLSFGQGKTQAQLSIAGSGMTPDQMEWPYTPQFQNVPVKFWLQVPPQSIVNRYGTYDYYFNVRVNRPDGAEVWNQVYGFNEKGYCDTSFNLPGLFWERSANRSAPDFGIWKIRLAVIEKDSRRDVALKEFALNFSDGRIQPRPPVGPSQSGSVVYLSDLKESNSGNIHGGLGKDHPYWQSDLIIAGRKFSKGLVTHPKAENGQWAFVEYNLDGQYSTFRATLGSAEDHGNYGKGTMNYGVIIDNRKVVGGAFPLPPRTMEINLDVRGARTLRLEVDNGYDGNNSDHGAWGDARLER